MKGVRFPRLHFRFVSGNFLLTCLALLIAFAVGALLGWFVAQNLVRMDVEERVDAQANRFETQLAEATLNLSTLSHWLIGQTDLRDLVHARDSKGLLNLLEPLIKASFVDNLIVTDTDGNVLAAASTVQAPPLGSRVLDVPGVRETLAGSEYNGYFYDPSGHLERQFGLPIYSADQKNLVGVLLLSFYMDDRFIQSLSMLEGAEIVIVNKGQILVSTGTVSSPSLLKGHPAPAEIIAYERQNPAAGSNPLALDFGNHIFHFRPLNLPDQKFWGVYGIGFASTSQAQTTTSIFIAIGGALLADLVVLVSILFVGRASSRRAIQSLNGSVAGMLQGDFSGPISLKRNDLIGDLAGELGSLQTKLRSESEQSKLVRQRYEAAIHSIASPIVITDSESHILAVNPPAETLLHDSEARFLGQPLMELFAMGRDGQNDSQANLNLETSQLAQNGKLTVRGSLPLRARPQVVVDIVSILLVSGDQRIGFVHLLQDASVVEQSSRAQDEFILNVAHELRGPLASLRASVEMLLEDYAVMNRHDMGVLLRTLDRSIVRFQGLVESLVDIGKLTAGQFRVQPTLQSFNRIVQDGLAQVEPLLQAKGQIMEIRMSSPQTCVVLADRVRVLQVIINLLVNASKYGPEEQAIVASTYTEGGFVFFQVTDYGPGIPPDQQANMFQRFYRIKRADEEGSGIGLGLALAKGIVEAHGGKIGLRSQPGNGSTFWFNLPEAKPQVDNAH